MTTIFVITAGIYSDYHIVTVFSSRDLAEKFTGTEPHPYSIEEYELDLFAEQVRAGLQIYSVRMHEDGSSSISLSEAGDAEPQELTLDTVFGKKVLWGRVWAQDKEHAAKIVNEKRAQLIASGEWPK